MTVIFTGLITLQYYLYANDVSTTKCL